MNSRRFESIGAILNRATSNPTTSDGEPQNERPATPRSASPASEGQPRPAAPTVRRPPPPPTVSVKSVSAKSDGGVRRIAFRLDPALHEALTGKAATGKISQGQVVLDCIEAAHQDGSLDDLVARERDDLQSGSLFPRLRSRGAAQATVPVEIRLHARAATVLDQLVEQTGADSRTQLIIAALRHSLTSAGHP